MSRRVGSRAAAACRYLTRMRRFAALLGLAVMAQVALSGWLTPCHERGTSNVAVDGAAAHHHGSTPDEVPAHGAPRCLASPACTVVMLGAMGVAAAEAAIPAAFDLGVVSPRVIAATAPECPPPKG